MGASIADILSNKEKSQLVLPNINKGDVAFIFRNYSFFWG